MVNLNIVDIGGHIIDRNNNKRYVNNAKGAFIVFDVTNRSSFQSVKDWIKYVNENCNDDPNNVVKILIGSKIDLKNRVVTEAEAKELANQYKMPYFECSSKTSKNIIEIFTIMANKVDRFHYCE